MKRRIAGKLPQSPTVLGRPIIGRIALLPWAVMVYAIVWGIGWYRRNSTFSLWPFSVDYGSQGGANFRTYQYAAELARAGEPFYEVAPPGLDAWAVYLYPPLTTIAFRPTLAVEWKTGWAIFVILNIIAGIVAAVLIVRYIERAGWTMGWLDMAFIIGLFILSPFTWGTMYYGNINLILALVFIVGFLAIENDRERLSGLLFGFAALFKVFPALFGVWYLYKRAWRAIAAAVAVGGGGLLAGLIVFGRDRTETFFRSVVWDRSETAAFVGGYSPHDTFYVTIQRPISQVLWTAWPNAPMDLLLPLSLLVAGAVLAAFYRDLEMEMDVLIAIFATFVVVVTLFPALQWYMVLLYFPMIPLLYLWDGNGRLLFGISSFVLFFNESPGSLVDWVREDAGVPYLMELLLVDIFTLASIQLYAIVGMLGACLWYQYWGSQPSPIAIRTNRLRERLHAGLADRRPRGASPQRGDD